MVCHKDTSFFLIFRGCIIKNICYLENRKAPQGDDGFTCKPRGHYTGFTYKIKNEVIQWDIVLCHKCLD